MSELIEIAAATAAGTTKTRRLLVVDDEPNILRSLRRLFRREPWELVHAGSGPEALEVLAHESVQLVLTDQRMPEMSGTELCRVIGQRWPEITRMILSGYSDVDTILGAINEGLVYKFLTKPWNDEELKLHVRRAFEQWELTAQNERLTREIQEQNQQLREVNALLDQQVSDASRGLRVSQHILDGIEVAVVTIDRNGLIVHANRTFVRRCAVPDHPPIGACAARVLSADLLRAIYPLGVAEPPKPSGELRLGNARMQWRCAELVSEGHCAGYSIALWELL